MNEEELDKEKLIKMAQELKAKKCTGCRNYKWIIYLLKTEFGVVLDDK